MSYNNFSYVYDQLMSDAPYDQWVDYTIKTIARHGNGNHLLDVGCGTGTLALLLIKEGFTVTGVDLSEEMLTVAQQKASEQGVSLPLFQLDMTVLQGLGEYDVVTVFCDALNYLPSEKDVKNTFRAIYEHLAQDGLFLFDVHSVHKIETVFQGQTFAGNEENASFIWHCDEGEYPASVEHDLSFFVREQDGRYRRFDESHLQRTFAVGTYRTWLAEAGFQIVKVSADFSDNPPNESSERIFFSAKKEDFSS
jgi:cyclopropane fatty-acyl-phospholipid synthase-like methyltransferase